MSQIPNRDGSQIAHSIQSEEQIREWYHNFQPVRAGTSVSSSPIQTKQTTSVSRTS